MMPTLGTPAERDFVASSAEVSKTLKPEVVAAGPTYVGRREYLSRTGRGAKSLGRGEFSQADNLAGTMRHRELERWYRLKNLQKTAQFLVVVMIALLIGGYAVSRIWRSDRDTFKIPTEVQSGSRIEKFSVAVPGTNPWQLKASSATVTDDMNVVALTGPTVVYQGGKGGTILLSADSGQWNRKSGNVHAHGNVVIRYQDMTFATGEIAYSQDKKQAETDAAVTMDGGGTRITGKGLRLSIPDEEIVIEHDVKARLSDVKWASNGSKLPW